MYVLILNDMRSSQIQTCTRAVWADTKEELVKLMADCKVEPWNDESKIGPGVWGKVYKKGSVLEWYNEPVDYYGQGIKKLPTLDEALKEAEENHTKHVKYLQSTVPHMMSEGKVFMPMDPVQQ